ncbi:putative mediator of RNA polymerase II transcription subunit 15 [Drosophila suzukii]|uniref:Mediator of RNA polymerase II transcription subunit 15 n=1 Tax=Drosophila suzukii TaxID=28584 RepID=A0ABM4TTS5_DROSZ
MRTPRKCGNSSNISNISNNSNNSITSNSNNSNIKNRNLSAAGGALIKQSLTSPQHHNEIDALTALQVEEVIYTQSQGNTSYQLDSETRCASNVQEPTLQQQHTAYEDRTSVVLPPYNLCIGNKPQPQQQPLQQQQQSLQQQQQPFEAEQQEQELELELEQKELENSSYEQFLKLSAHEYSEPERSSAAALNLSSIGEKEAAVGVGGGVESKTELQLEDPPEFRMLRGVGATIEEPKDQRPPNRPTADGISNKGREP